MESAVATVVQTSTQQECGPIPAERALMAQLEGLRRLRNAGPIDRRLLERRVRAVVADWRGLMGRQISESRRLLKGFLEGRVVFTPQPQRMVQVCRSLFAATGIMRHGADVRASAATSPRLITREAGGYAAFTCPRSGTVNLKRWWVQRDSSAFVR